jgi:hypothetical protein
MSKTETIDAYIDVVRKYPRFAIETAAPAMEQTTLYLLGRLPDYPQPPTARPDGVSFMSDKQRAWFFAAVKRGEVKGWRWTEGRPEKFASARTNNLGRKFTEKVTATDESVLGQLGTNVPYAPWVVGPAYPGEAINGKTMYQARIHQDRWWQFYDVMDKNMEAAWQVFEKYFWPEFLKRVQGDG